MNTRLWTVRAALASSLAVGMLAATGCTVQTTTATPTGQLTVDWTIDESTDQNLCAQSNASSFHLRIIAQSTGSDVADYSADCTAGVTTVTLDQGSYSAQAWLEDPSNVNRTTTVPIAPFAITSSPLSISIDFPANSFE